jgi:hypothetical protein
MSAAVRMFCLCMVFIVVSCFNSRTNQRFPVYPGTEHGSRA